MENIIIYFNNWPGIKSEIADNPNYFKMKKVDSTWLIENVNYFDEVKTELENYISFNKATATVAKEKIIQNSKVRTQKISS